MKPFETIEINILDPKVKPLLRELHNLGLISWNESSRDEQKKALFEKLQGKNLKDIDVSHFSKK